MLSQKQWFALLVGVLLVSAPLIRAEEEEYEDDDAEEAGGDKGGEEKDVVVITKDNWETAVKKSKFALVSYIESLRGLPGMPLTSRFANQPDHSMCRNALLAAHCLACTLYAPPPPYATTIRHCSLWRCRWSSMPRGAATAR
jgi:hypothetical protein